MLERIHDDKWKELQTQSTDATNIPNAIVALLSECEEDFEKAYWQIENHVVVQGDLYSAAALVPKYLEKVYLQSAFKHGVAELLFQIGGGYSSDALLRKTCFDETVKVYKNLLAHPSICGTEYAVALNEDLLSLKEIFNDNNAE